MTPRAGAFRRTAAARAATAAVFGCVAAVGCQQADRPPPPATVSLSVSADAVEEADNRTVQVAVELDSPTATGVTVRLNFAGSATRGRDYAVSSDAIVVARNTSSGTVDIDVYRDFDAEGDETLTVGVARIAGHAREGGRSSVTLTILDGEAATVDKAPPEDSAPELLLLPFFFGVTEDAVSLVVLPR